MNDDLKHLWKEQAMTPTAALDLQAIKARVKRTHRSLAWRNALEYGACMFIIVVFSFYITAFPSLLMRIGSALVILGTLVLAWQLHRRASSRPLPDALGAQPWLAFQRAQLERQRDALRSAWLWYVAPLVPGVVVFRWGVETELPAGAPFAQGWAANLLLIAVFAAVAGINRLAARQLQKRIDALDGETP